MPLLIHGDFGVIRDGSKKELKGTFLELAL